MKVAQLDRPHKSSKTIGIYLYNIGTSIMLNGGLTSYLVTSQNAKQKIEKRVHSTSNLYVNMTK